MRGKGGMSHMPEDRNHQEPSEQYLKLRLKHKDAISHGNRSFRGYSANCRRADVCKMYLKEAECEVFSGFTWFKKGNSVSYFSCGHVNVISGSIQDRKASKESYFSLNFILFAPSFVTVINTYSNKCTQYI